VTHPSPRLAGRNCSQISWSRRPDRVPLTESIRHPSVLRASSRVQQGLALSVPGRGACGADKAPPIAWSRAIDEQQAKPAWRNHENTDTNDRRLVRRARRCRHSDRDRSGGRGGPRDVPGSSCLHRRDSGRRRHHRYQRVRRDRRTWGGRPGSVTRRARHRVRGTRRRHPPGRELG
jgi:hypothetical protein